MPRSILTPLAALALALAAAGAARADAPAKPKRTFEQQVTLTQLGDATVRLKWSLPEAEYNALQRSLGPVTTTRDKDGKTVVSRARPTSQELLFFFNLNILDVATRDVKVSADDAKREVTATFKV